MAKKGLKKAAKKPKKTVGKKKSATPRPAPKAKAKALKKKAGAGPKSGPAHKAGKARAAQKRKASGRVKAIKPETAGRQAARRPTEQAAGGPKAEKPRSSSRGGYKFLEHTADIMVQAWGKDYLQALEQAALAMFSVLGKARPAEFFEIEEAAHAREDLVVYLLARVLGECDARELVPARIEWVRYDPARQHIFARVWGERIRPKDAIKAVTFHRLEVAEEKGKCTIQVVFDV